MSILVDVTVEGKEAKFSNINKTHAKAVHKLQDILVSPSNNNLTNAVENNIVGPISFTRRDIRISTVIHGQWDVAALKGKTTNKPSKILNIDKIKDVSSHIVKMSYKVTLTTCDADCYV